MGVEVSKENRQSSLLVQETREPGVRSDQKTEDAVTRGTKAEAARRLRRRGKKYAKVEEAICFVGCRFTMPASPFLRDLGASLWLDIMMMLKVL